MKLTNPVGNWWLAYDNDEVWPCDVLRPCVWPGTVVVVPTHEAAPDYGSEIVVSCSRVYDSAFNRPKWITA
jgi:hypothetical protein